MAAANRERERAQTGELKAQVEAFSAASISRHTFLESEKLPGDLRAKPAEEAGANEAPVRLQIARLAPRSEQNPRSAGRGCRGRSCRLIDQTIKPPVCGQQQQQNSRKPRATHEELIKFCQAGWLASDVKLIEMIVESGLVLCFSVVVVVVVADVGSLNLALTSPSANDTREWEKTNLSLSFCKCTSGRVHRANYVIIRPIQIRALTGRYAREPEQRFAFRLFVIRLSGSFVSLISCCLFSRKLARQLELILFLSLRSPCERPAIGARVRFYLSCGLE